MGSRLDTNNDGYFDHEERRHLAEAMRESRRYDNYDDRGRYDDDEDPAEFFIKFFLVGGVILFLVLGGVFFGAEHLDAWFGWNLTGWLEENIPIGNPFK